MHGGLNIYRNTPAAARRYLEADRSRADDYYLTEGTGLAERFSASPTVGVGHVGTLSGDEYEAWVAGVDPDTGVPKGHLRKSDNAVRFVEITVNGPKSWSLAAAIHPNISAAYDSAQERAAEQIIGWLAQHASTRIGPRGAQLQVPVEQIEAVTVRHYTSRAGDPHRHLHLQVNARVLAEGRWYALHTLGVRDSLDAINGIGHAAVMTDPGFREALAGHGFTLDADGELTQMREFVGAFSQRAMQIEGNLDRYEAAWKKSNPGREPGRSLRQRWDHQAWNHARPGKIVPRDGAEITARWLAELHALGYRDPAGPVLEMGVRPGELDRDRAVATVLARLGARRSAWNAADLRGELEQHLTRSGVVAAAAIRIELAEDLTARALSQCVALLDRPGLPEHVRALTSRHVLDVEADLTARILARAATTPTRAPVPDEVVAGLDCAQREVVAALAGNGRLLVVEGAAGSGKTTTLAAVRTVIESQGQQLIVVTPTKKAAQVAAKQLGTAAFSAAWLAHQHGWRWDEHGTWTRLEVGQADRHARGRQRPYLGPAPEAVLRPGDVLLVDEAGMLDQDTAHALLHVADQTRARIVLVGDRHQLPAVGRGGVLDLAARFTAPEAKLELTTVHRFTDPDYANLSAAMRTGEYPGHVFDTLIEKGLVRVYSCEIERTDTLADKAAHAIRNGEQVRVLADTNQQVAQLNTAIRDRLIQAGRVDNQRAVTTLAGQRIGAGDMVMTRQNDTDLAVANRQTWTVTGLTRHGELAVTSEQGDRTLPGEYARTHVELAYACTVHGGQGETVEAAHFALGEHTAAANAYVALTRGRDANTVHIVAENIAHAREQWIDTFSRDRADLGPAVAAQRAAVEADRYTPQRTVADALADLRAAWTVEDTLDRELLRATGERDQLRQYLTTKADYAAALAPLHAERHRAAQDAQAATRHADQLTETVETTATRYADRLKQQWDHLRPDVREIARTVLDGPGRFGIHHRRVENATAELTQWADNWRPAVPDLPTDPQRLARMAAGYDGHHVCEHLNSYARAAAEHHHPQHRTAVHNAATATEHARHTETTYRHAFEVYDRRLTDNFGNIPLYRDPANLLDRQENFVSEVSSNHDSAVRHVRDLMTEPALRTLPTDRLQTERDTWRHARNAQLQAERAAAERAALGLDNPTPRRHVHQPATTYTMRPPQHDHGISI